MTTFQFLVRFIGVFLFSSAAFAEQPNWQTIQKSIEDKMKAAQVSALQMSYLESDGTQHDFNLGTTELNGNKPVTDETRFYSASLTKMLTAISLFQLREKGLVDFEEKIVHHFPELMLSTSPQMNEVTIRQILSHTSGFARNGEPFWTDLELITQGVAPTQRDVFSAAIKQKFGVALDSQLKYSNLGYELLGLLVGKLCQDCRGSSFTSRYIDHVKKHILLPLQMKKSGFNPSLKMAKSFATPYQLIDSKGSRNPFPLIRDSGASVAAWGLYSTSKDMLKFMKELGQIISQQKNVLVKSDISNEVVNAVLHDSLNSSFGHSLGFRLMKIVDENKNIGYLVGHTGTFPGFSSAAFYNTLNKSAGVVYFNVVDGGGVGYLMLATTPTSGITQLPGTSNFGPQEVQETQPNNPYSGIVKKWGFIYGKMEVIYEGEKYFFVQSGQKMPLYLQLSPDSKALVGSIGTNAGYLDFVGDSIRFSLDEKGNSEFAVVANGIHIKAEK